FSSRRRHTRSKRDWSSDVCSSDLILIVAGGLSSCSALFQGGGGAVIGSSFTAEDEDIIGANDDYKALETALRNRLNGIEEEYPRSEERRVGKGWRGGREVGG